MATLPYGTAVTHRTHPGRTGKVVGWKGDKVWVQWPHLRRRSSTHPDSLTVVQVLPGTDVAHLRAVLKEALTKALEWEARGHPWPSAPFIVRRLSEIGWR
jgi:hypothetical protein